jgi:hypothetical protein
MISNKALIAVAVLSFTVPVAPALAHDDYGDHVEHGQHHQDLSEAHRRAHEEGFYSRGEHNAYHRALRDLHQDFHDDHPGNWHDHYRWRGYYGGYNAGYNSWSPYYGGWRYNRY